MINHGINRIQLLYPNRCSSLKEICISTLNWEIMTFLKQFVPVILSLLLMINKWKICIFQRPAISLELLRIKDEQWHYPFICLANVERTDVFYTSSGSHFAMANCKCNRFRQCNKCFRNVFLCRFYFNKLKRRESYTVLALRFHIVFTVQIL